jgi:hypothetical protein
MKSCRYLAPALALLLLAGCGGSSSVDRAEPQEPATNPDGEPVDGVITAVFDPGNGNIPLPNSLLLSGTTDLTLNPPVADPNDFTDPLAALSTLDGFSTVAPGPSASRPGRPGHCGAGQLGALLRGAVRLRHGCGHRVNREMVPGQDYVAVVAVGSDRTDRPWPSCHFARCRK